ncbi:MAG TPA: DNA sulfur modification protein DndB [Mucilaginibacter sp.]|jgi:DNA sulfur modification protein DndB|nr:DNA sulfur modification protein DndB [Mucilaginibacter sp.]
MSNIKKIDLPCLRGKMGDWFYYVTVLKFSEVARRVKLPKEINAKYDDKNLKLSEWIQREIDDSRIDPIVNYLKTEQRFFNSLILGIYDGKPSWHDIEFQLSDFAAQEEEIDYFSRTFGILSLTGAESIFAIDGQHRAVAIRKAVSNDKSLLNDEIAAIFVAHKATVEGNMRTRRLFSTLNRYAKPVSQAETIALSEDDNSAIITRRMVDNFPLFKTRILTTKNRAINPENVTDFTNIMVLYDMVRWYLTNTPIFGFKLSGKPARAYSETREPENILLADQKVFEELVLRCVDEIGSLKTFFDGKAINRKLRTTSLLFRPVGQNVFISVLKIAKEQKKLSEGIQYFGKGNFSLSNRLWAKVFFDANTSTIIPDKSRQRFATLLIVEHLGVPVKRTAKDKEILTKFQALIKHVGN